jgi:hypothetical protein
MALLLAALLAALPVSTAAVGSADFKCQRLHVYMYNCQLCMCHADYVSVEVLLGVARLRH